MSVVIVFDIGGTNMRVAAAHGEDIGEVKKVPTPQNPEEAIAKLKELAQEVAGDETVTAAGGDIRGIIVDGVYWKDKALPKWEGIRLEERLRDVLRVPVLIKNDCAVIGLGEAHKGAGRGSNIMAYITVSTGVGGARIDNGEIDHYVYGFEVGRQLVMGEELENLVSGTAVKEKFGVEPKELADLSARNELADTLAVGLYNTCLHWSPDTFVLGGSMMTGVNPIPLDRVRESLKKRLTMYPQSPEIKMAELGDYGGLHGGRVLAAMV